MSLAQDLYCLLEIFFLCPVSWIAVLLTLFQWEGVVLANRARIRMSLSQLRLLREPRSLIGSAKSLSLLIPLVLGVPFSCTALLLSRVFSPIALLWLAVFGALISLWARKLGAEEELESSNPLFFVQWRWLIYPKNRRKAGSFSIDWEISRFLDSRYPAFRKTLRHLGEKRFDIRFESDPDVVFLFLESFRAENVGALGAANGVTPHFDELSEEGVLFTECSSTGTLTFQALLSALYGIPSALDTYSLDLYAEVPLLGAPHLLKKKGYRTALMQGGYTSFDGSAIFGRKQGFDLVVGAEEWTSSATSWGIHDDALYSRASQWLSSADSPSFLALFTISNHHPWENPYPGDTEQEGSDVEAKFLRTMRYSDEALGKFIRQIQRPTLFFITGDHGESVDPKGLRHDLGQKNLHVPLLIYAKGKTRKLKIDAPCSHIDLAPTLIDLLGIEEPHHSLGRSLLRQGEGPIYFSLIGEPVQRGCRVGSLKWTGLYNGKGSRVCDLSEDPLEARSLQCKEEELLREKTLDYFAAAHRLTKLRLWSPERGSESFSFGPESEDKEVERVRVAREIDLSPCRKMTDQALFAASKMDLLRIALPNSPFITDEGVIAVGTGCPSLVQFIANGCPLVTQRGVEKILENCPRLKFLSVDGIEGIESLNPKITSTQLAAIFLGDSHEMRKEFFTRLLSVSPFLSYLSFNAKDWEADDLLRCGLTRLNHLEIHCAPIGIEKIAETNPFLWRIKVSEGKAEEFSCRSSALRELSIRDFPFLREIRWGGAPPANVALENCPLLRPGCLEELPSGSSLSVRGCSAISKEFLTTLSARGVNVF
jgi:hypothetical protein